MRLADKLGNAGILIVGLAIAIVILTYPSHAGPQQERHEVKLSPDAMLKIQVADLQQRLAETQAELGTVRKQLVELQSNDTRRLILMAECERGKIPVAECKYDPVVSSVFRLSPPEVK